MRKIFKTIANFIEVILVLGVAFLAGYYVRDKIVKPKGDIVQETGNSFDLKLPGETKRRLVTVEDVRSKLQEMSDLTTYSGEYAVTLGKEETRYILEDLIIPGTTNSITISASGIVKVGYDISDIVLEVDDDKIYITLPEAKQLDNYVIWDTITCSERNNILNPIKFSQYQELIEDIEQKGLEDVKRQNIYGKAEKNLKKIMNGFLSEFVDYKIVYR